MPNWIKSFATAEDGAVTVDWVVLTAAIVGIGLAVIYAIGNGTSDVSSDLSASLSNGSVANLGSLGFN